jgi:predicted RND superfamily exporter protein
MTVVFRSWKLGLISILPNAFPLVTTAAWLVMTGRPLELTSVIVFSICLGIAVDDTIHVINRFQRELSAGTDVQTAIKRTFIAVGSALATTTIVLIVGFGSVSVSEMPTSQLFAKLGMIAIFAALIGDLIFLPAMLAYFVKQARSA